MIQLQIYVARIDAGNYSGEVFSFDPIVPQEVSNGSSTVRVSRSWCIILSAPDEFIVETPYNYSRNLTNEHRSGRMLFDPKFSTDGAGGRAYIDAFRAVQQSRHPGPFVLEEGFELPPAECS